VEIMLNDLVTVSIPKKPDYISTVRLISSSLGNKMGYNIDQIEDLKVAMGEACILSFGKAIDDEVKIVYNLLKEKLEVVVSWAESSTEKDEESKESNMGRMIIESLTDEVYYLDNEIKIVKYID
jgi:serine/threonine-protein kinase RsbW